MEKRIKFNLTKKRLLIISIVVMLIAIMTALGLIISKSKVNNYSFGSDLKKAEIEQMKTYDRVESNDSDIENCSNVKFDAFFVRDLDGTGYVSGVRGSCIQIGSQDTLYMELKVENGGYLKDAQILINNDNFYFETAIPKDDIIAKSCIGYNIKEIPLNEIESGKYTTLTATVRSGDYSSPERRIDAIKDNTTKYSNNEESENRNSVTLVGTYVNADGEETPIKKEVYFNLDWHGTTSTTLPTYLGYYEGNYKRQSSNIEHIVNEEKHEVNVAFQILTRENNNELLLGKSEVEIEIPELNGYAPTRVEVQNAELKEIYDEETGKIIGATITKTVNLNENNEITEKVYTDTRICDNNFYRYNIYNVKFFYPMEAYSKEETNYVQLIVPVKAYYEGYNNTSDIFKNPYKSNIAEDEIIVTYKEPSNPPSIRVKNGEYFGYPHYKYIISKKNAINIYNGKTTEDENDKYTVSWTIDTGNQFENVGVILKENRIGEENNIYDYILTEDNQKISMQNISKFTGLYLSNPKKILGEDGWIKIYDDDDPDSEPLVTFTKENWSNYNLSNPYQYDEPVNHIRIETSNVELDSGMTIYNIKEIDVDYITENYTKEEFNNFIKIESTLNGYFGENHFRETTHEAYYEEPISIAEVSVSKSKLPTTESERFNIYIDPKVSDYTLEKWANGTFLLKLPKEITNIEINNVNVTDKRVDIANYEILEKDDNLFIKVITQNVEPSVYRITIDCTITPDSTALSSTKYIELYAINDNCINYSENYSSTDEYDLNDNDNREELVSRTSAGINFVSSNNLLSNETVTNFDNKETVIYGPSVAGITNQNRTARININIINNYESTNSEITILGRIPFEGNKYTDNGNDMGSKFTAIMSNEGITIPQELKNIVTVYYSENGEATKDFTESNNWQTVPTDFSKVKSYMIYFDRDYRLQRREGYQFSYQVTVPQEVNLNEESYGHHAIYFCWDTPQGKYRTQIEPTKVGIAPVEKFNLGLTKFQKGVDKIVPGAIYSVTEIKTNEAGEEERGSSKSAITRDNGILEITDLNVEKLYEIKEVKSPENYELNENTIRFYTSVNSETRDLEVEIVGETRNNKDVEINQEERKISFEVEDEVKSKLRIVKIEKGNDSVKIKNARFTITGNGLPESGKVITTNIDGIAEISGLSIGSTYTIQETKSATGYYLLEEPINFKVVNNNGEYKIEVEKNENIISSSIEVEDFIPTTVLNITNEKVPIFKIVKTEKESGNPLSRVRYKLYGKGISEKGTTLTTNTNGEITLQTLYLNEEYILQETKAVEGYYIKPETIKFKIVNNNGNYSLEILEGRTAVKATETTDTNGIPTLILKMDNEKIPTFNLDITKVEKDKPETLLVGAKFRLYREDKLVAEGISGEDGKVVFNNLYQYVEDKIDVMDATYTLREVEAPIGYVPVKDITFKVEELNGTLKYEEENLEREYAVEGNTVKIVIEDSPTFKLIKVDGDQTEEVRLPNTKFAIYNIDGDEEVPATDSNGNRIGTREIIDGIEYYTLTTDENGEFRAELLEGFYKAVEVKANNDKFDISNQTYYFGIGKSKKNVELKLETVNQLLGNYQKTSDGGYISYYTFSGDLELSNGDNLTSKSNRDGLLIKYDNAGNIEWYQQLSQVEYTGNNSLYINSIVETPDGKFLTSGYFYGNKVEVGNNIFIESYETYSNYNQYYMTILYDIDGNVEWTINGRVAKKDVQDGGYIVCGIFRGEQIVLQDNIVLKNNTKYEACAGHNGTTHMSGHMGGCDNKKDAYFYDGFVVKYDSTGKAEWNNVIESDKNITLNISYSIDIKEKEIDDSDVDIIFGNRNAQMNQMGQSLLDNGELRELSNGSYMIEGNCSGSQIDYGNGIIEQVLDSGLFFVIYDNNGEIVNGRISAVSDIIETEDKGFITYGNFYNEIDLRRENNVEPITGETNRTGLIVKYNEFGITEWYKTLEEIKGTSTENSIDSVRTLSDGSYISFGTLEYRDENNNLIREKLIVKYNSLMQEEWRQIIGEVKGTSYCYNNISNLIETSDNGYIFYGQIQYIDGDNNQQYERILVKLTNDGKIDWTKFITSPEGRNSLYSYTIYEIYGNIFVQLRANNISEKIDIENGIEITEEGRYLLAYNSERQAEWIIKYAETSGTYYPPQVYQTYDGENILYISKISEEPVNIGNNITLDKTGRYTIKYDNNGIPQWAIIGTYNDIMKLEDESYISELRINEEKTINLGNNITVSGPETYIIKYDSNNNIQQVIRGHLGGNQILMGLSTEKLDSGYKINRAGDDVLLITLYEEQTLDLGNGMILDGPGQFNIDLENKIVTKVENEDNSMFFSSGKKTIDGGKILTGTIYTETKLENGAILNTKGEIDGVIIKYDKDNNIEWYKTFGGSKNDSGQSIKQTKDEGYIVIADIQSIETISFGNGVTLENTTPGYAMIKYDNSGKAQWVNKIASYEISNDIFNSSSMFVNSIKETEDESYIFDLSISGTIEFENIKISNSSNYGNTRAIVKYNAIEKNEDNPIVEYAKSIGGNLNEQVTHIISTSDGGYLTSEYKYEEAGFTVSVVKYNQSNEEQWRVSNLGQVTSMCETSDDEYAVLIYNGYIIKIDNSGNIRWQKSIKNEAGSRAIISRPSRTAFNSIIEADENEFVVVGQYDADSLDLGNNIILENTSNTISPISSMKCLSGVIIKYKENETKSGCDVVWARDVNGTENTTLSSVIKSDDGILVAGKYFSEDDIILGNGIALPSNSTEQNGIILKYDNNGIIQSYNIVDNEISFIEKVTNGYIGVFNKIVNAGQTVLPQANQEATRELQVVESQTVIAQVIKYNENGSTEWIKEFEKTTISSIEEAQDGGYIVGGFFEPNTSEAEEDIRDTDMAEDMVKFSSSTDSEQSSRMTIIHNISKLSGTGIIFKLNRDGEEEWRKEIEKSTINDVTQIKDGGYIGVGAFDSESVDLGNGFVLENESDTYRDIIKNEWNEETEEFEPVYSDEEYYYSDGMIVKLNAEMMIPEKQELTIKNFYKRFNITTEVEEVNGEKGGTISGEKLTSYEKVIYGENSIKPIIMTPEQDYEIIGVTVNGKEYPLENLTYNEEDGTYTMPNFENVTQDIHVKVTYSYKENRIIINKVDSDTKEPLQGAMFKLMPEEYIELDYLDQMYHLDMDEYYFEKSEDGSYNPNNQGKDNTMAYSSIEIDLTDYEGNYTLEVNAGITTNNPLYYGQAIVRSQSSSSGSGGVLMSMNDDIEPTAIIGGAIRPQVTYLVDIRGNVEDKNYTMQLEGGNKYTLDFIYSRMTQGGSILQSEIVDTNIENDTFRINSVKVMSADVPTYIVETNSNGQAITNIPFGNYTIKEVKAPEGYILNEEPMQIEFRSAQTGENPEEIHTFTIENTKKPTVTVHYYKIDEEGNHTTESIAEDVILSGNPDSVYKTEIINEIVKDGIEYELEYELNNDGTKTRIIPENWTGKFILGENQEVNYYYSEKKVPVIVHHYIYGTNIKVPLNDGNSASDERILGNEGEEYETNSISPDKLAEEYELVAVPENSTGTFIPSEVVVTYYYKKIDKNVSIFKYTLEKQVNEETGEQEEIKVPLSGAEFTILNGAENTTGAESRISDTDIAEEMTKYNPNEENNTTRGIGQINPDLIPEQTIYITDENGMIDVKLEVGTYTITEVKAPEGYILPEGENARHEIVVNKETEDGQVIEILNTKEQGTVIVHHYQMTQDGELTEIPVKLKDGTDAPVVEQTGSIGDIYATQQIDNLPVNWTFAKAEGPTSGVYGNEPINVYYYYQELDFKEKINIELTKIWKDNEIQALRRPKTIKFIVTRQEEMIEEVFSGEKVVSEEVYGNVEEQNNTDNASQEEVTNSDTSNADTISKEQDEKLTENSENPEQVIESTEQENNDSNEIANNTIDKTNKTLDETDSNTVNNSSNETKVSEDLENKTEENTTVNNTAENNVVSNTTNTATNTVVNELKPSTVETVPVLKDTLNAEQDENTQEAASTQERVTPTTEEMEIYKFEYVVNVMEGESYTYTLEGLPKYDPTTGKALRYTITETYDKETGSKDDLKFYKSEGGVVTEVIDENGNVKYTSRIVNTFTLPENNVKNIKATKIWNDRENERTTRPPSIILELVGRIQNLSEENTTIDISSKEQTISSANNMEYTFENNPIYNENGQEIEYSVDEKETVEGNLNKYSKQINVSEDKSEFTITNSLNVQGSNITKTGSEKLRAIDGKVNYSINYTVELDANYQDENVEFTVVDSLPYKLSDKERNLAGGEYNEEAQTITWTGKYNTNAEEQVVVWNDGSKTPVTLDEENSVKVVTFNKEISFAYLGITVEDENKTIINNVLGTVKLEKSEETVSAKCETLTEWRQNIIINKLWQGDTEETRPDSIEVELKQIVKDENGNETLEDLKGFNETIVPTIDENGQTQWSYTLEDYPRYDADGNEFKFTADETAINYKDNAQTVENQYYCEKSEEVIDGKTVVTLTNNKYGSITVTKVDSRKEELKLPGAEFKLERVIKDETTGEWIVPDENSEEYAIATGITGEDGTLTFNNLKYGYYKLTETKAPEDYRIAEKDIEVIEVSAESSEKLNVQVTVKNDKQYSLPTTGGIGTNIVRSAEILAVIILVILITNRKKIVPERRTKAENKVKPVRRNQGK